jgi:hypothetical protein
MQGEKFTLMQYNVSAVLGFIEAGQFIIHAWNDDFRFD